MSSVFDFTCIQQFNLPRASLLFSTASFCTLNIYIPISSFLLTLLPYLEHKMCFICLFQHILIILFACLSASSPVPGVNKPASASVSKEFMWKVQGLNVLGHKCRSTGDVFAATYCYCGAPDYGNLTRKWPEAHYMEANYYNRHMNETFMVSETCKSTTRMDCLGHKWKWIDPKELDSPMGRENRPYSQDEWGMGYREIQWNGQCGYWPSAPMNKNGYYIGHSPWDGNPHFGQGVLMHKFCYFPNPGDQNEYAIHEGRSDRIYFNGQKRWLLDGQGYVDFADQMARDVCTPLCLEKTGLPILPWHEDQVPSHQGCALELDDMCQHCK